MSQRFSLFYAGFCASAPMDFFNHLLLEDLVKRENTSDLFQIPQVLSQRIENQQAEQNLNLNKAENIARSFDLLPPALPASAHDYFQWLPAFVEVFEAQFPMSRIDHYYFLFGRKISEIIANLRLADTCMELQNNVEPPFDLSRKTDKCLKDNEYILFKLIAPAALLSSEHGQNFFNVYYKDINASFEPFRSVELETLNKKDLLELSVLLREYDKKVNEGFQICLEKLRELGV